VEYIAGGAAQNAIRATQWMLQVPHAAHYIGCIGNDPFGKTLKEAAEKDGVTTHYLVDPTTPTGTCAVLVRDKERLTIMLWSSFSDLYVPIFQLRISTRRSTLRAKKFNKW
jgi:sugar/nucleoside kinase (ribokinase family)